MPPKKLKSQTKVKLSDGSENKSINCSDDCIINNVNNEQTNGDNNSNISQTNGTNFDYSPKICLRCHCKSNDPFDNSTAIWGVAFQPKTTQTDANRFVATCAANMVCIIDCVHSINRTGRSVIARYIDDDPNEEFVSICWSTISTSPQDINTLVLAVGGKNKILLLSNLNRYHSYEKVSAHSDQINSLVFTQSDQLLSASFDMKIKLWRISHPNQKSLTQLLKTVETNHLLLSVCFSLRHQMVMASGEKGVTFWLNPFDESNQPILSLMKTKGLVDGLKLIPEEEDFMAIRIHSTKCISIIDLKKVMETHKTDKSDKTGNKSKIKQILYSHVLKTELRSFDSEYPYIYLSAEKNILVSGGPKGQIWLYDTQHLSESEPNQMLAENKVIEWPLIDNIKKDSKMIVDLKDPFFVNTVAISPDHKLLIACTSVNLILIWSKP